MADHRGEFRGDNVQAGVGTHEENEEDYGNVLDELLVGSSLDISEAYGGLR